MAQCNEPRRRHAPVPLETTFKSVRSNGPHVPDHIGPKPELTPEPSPRSCSPALPEAQRPRRRFKPQLIETSRRTRRLGDPGPATRPTDKTDITPYTNHIYVSRARTRRRRGESLEGEPSRHMPPTRRETEDDGVKEYLLELAATEAARQIEEDALAAFPNSRAREGGVAHFYFHESSDSDKSAEGTPQPRGPASPQLRRKSSNLGLNWWHKHMQEHAAHLPRRHDDHQPAAEEDTEEDIIMRTDSDLDKMDLPVPPNPLWTTSDRPLIDDEGALMMDDIQSLRRSIYAISQPGRPAPRVEGMAQVAAELATASATGDRPAEPAASSPSLPPLKAHRAADVGRSGRPFGPLGLQPDDPELRLMRKAASPPMLGKDLTFWTCPSPKQTKLETDHPFVDAARAREENRDVSGHGGLWRGYCCKTASNSGYVVPADLHPAAMIVTPHPPGTPRALSTVGGPGEVPDLVYTSSDSSDSAPGLWVSKQAPQVEQQQQPTALKMLRQADDRLQREKTRAERDEQISSEFDDEFVTQVYNYLSLGYPAMARCYDEELSKITHVSVEELERDDEREMAKGHMLEMRLEDQPEDERCPRWQALKTYILEWARQHPNLDKLDPLAWGVRERRGSWAL